MNRNRVFAVITGGGTSGHVMPALAIAEMLQEAGITTSGLHFIGCQNGVEASLVEQFGISMTLLNVRGFKRSFSARSILDNLATIRRFMVAKRQARKLLANLQPEVVISVGGFASVAATAAAFSLKIPVITVSYDRRPGLATKLQSRRAKASAVAYWPSSLPNAYHTGAPVRRELRRLDVDSQRSFARMRLGLPTEGLVISIVGGSLGSELLNQVADHLIGQTSSKSGISILQVTGERYFKEKPVGLNVKRVPNLPNLVDLYAASDLVLSRAGGSTVAELATVGQASVLVPWAKAAENHQYNNAKWLADLGGALVLDENIYSVTEIAAKVTELIDDPARLTLMRTSARQAGTKNRTTELCDLIFSVANSLDLSQHLRIHIVGVGGPGMSAIAILLHEMGHLVTGSDIHQSKAVSNLERMGIRVNIPHSDLAVVDCSFVTGSTAVPTNNLEYLAAAELKIPILSRAEVLQGICRRAYSIGVAGTHGKTTTTAMLSHILVAANLKPSFLIGAEVPGLSNPAKWVDESVFVVEADESDGTHLQLPLSAVIITNIDVDHLDHFNSVEGIKESFDSLARKTLGPKILCLDDLRCASISTTANCTTYSAKVGEKNLAADFVATEISFRGGGSQFQVSKRTPDGHQVMGRIETGLQGIHNVRNALATIAMADKLAVDFQIVQSAIASFGGVRRRFDIIGTHDGVTYVDDYAHLPNEIAAVLVGVRDGSQSWGRVVAVFQPNRYNRMSLISDLYSDCFVAADVVVIMDIYASGTCPIPGVTGALVAEAIRKSHPEANVSFVPDRGAMIDGLAKELTTGDLCISMGCGDIEHLPQQLIAAREELKHR